MANVQNTYITVDKSRYEIFIGSDAKVERDQKYDRESKTRTNKVHKDTGLPVWVVNAEIVDTETQKIVGDKLKILASSQPDLRARSLAHVDGDLRVFAWADAKGNGHQAWNVLGTLTTETPKSSTSKAAGFAGGDAK